MRYVFALTLSVLCTTSLLAAQAPEQQAAPRDPAAQQQPAKPATPATPAPQDERPATPATPSASSQANKVTYTGCLKPGTTPDSWMLENAEVASAAGTTTKAPAATGTSGVGASKTTTLGLTVKPGENLKPHANHKIQVVGTLSPASRPSGEAAAGVAGAGAGAGAAGAPTQNFTVESFKMVSATCP